MSEGGEFLKKAAESIVTDSKVINAGQQLVKTTAQGGMQIAAATGAAIIGTGTTAGIGTAISTTGAAITTAGSALGTALVGAATSIATVALPIIGVAVIIGGIASLFDD